MAGEKRDERKEMTRAGSREQNSGGRQEQQQRVTKRGRGGPKRGQKRR